MLKVYYCKECLEQLSEYGAPAVILFEEICEYFAQTETPYIMILESYERDTEKIARFLELKHYIVTTEDDAFIYAKPSGWVSYEYPQLGPDKEFKFGKTRCGHYEV